MLSSPSPDHLPPFPSLSAAGGWAGRAAIPDLRQRRGLASALGPGGCPRPAFPQRTGAGVSVHYAAALCVRVHIRLNSMKLPSFVGQDQLNVSDFTWSAVASSWRILLIE